MGEIKVRMLFVVGLRQVLGVIEIDFLDSSDFD